MQLEVTGASFAFCSVGGATVAPNHVRVTNANIQLGSPSNFNWFFNQVPVPPTVDLDENFFMDGFEAIEKP